ncbi:MAG: methyltransferase domain-containing protein [Gemmatimonadetes bacterium]|nr:methyltransferase domain-containing protein [Gemmatimonadota bacterium]
MTGTGPPPPQWIMRPDSLLASVLRRLKHSFALERVRVVFVDWRIRRKMERTFARADPFDYSRSAFDQDRHAAILGVLGPPPLGRVLEVGCAEGTFTVELARHCAEVVAIDISATAVARARERLKAGGIDNVTLVVANIRSWRPVRLFEFDVVVLADVFPYLGHRTAPAEFAALVKRVTTWLRPGGRVVITSWFASDEERRAREAHAACFLRQGLRLEREEIRGAGLDRPGLRYLFTVLRVHG